MNEDPVYRLRPFYASDFNSLPIWTVELPQDAILISEPLLFQEVLAQPFGIGLIYNLHGTTIFGKIGCPSDFSK